MARRRGYYYGLGGAGSPVAQQLNILGANIRGGMGDIADDIRSGAQLRMEEKLLGHKLGREAAQDERQAVIDKRTQQEWEVREPQLRIEKEKAVREEQRRAEPFRPTDVFGDVSPTIEEAMHVAGHPTKDIRALGYEFKTNEDGSIKHLEKDGTILTKGFVEDNPGPLNDIITGWTRPDRAIAGKRAKLTKFRDGLKKGDPQIKQVNSAIAELDAIEKSPERMLKRWGVQEQKQLKLIREMESRGADTTRHQKELKYIREQMEYLQGAEGREVKLNLDRQRIKESEAREAKLDAEAAAKKLGKGTTEKDKFARQEKLVKAENTIMDGMHRIGDQTPELVAPSIRLWNAQPDAPYHYKYVPEKVTPWGSGGPDIDSQIVQISIPTKDEAPATTPPVETPTTKGSPDDEAQHTRYKKLRDSGLTKEEAYAQLEGTTPTTTAAAKAPKRGERSPRTKRTKAKSAGFLGGMINIQRGGPEAHYEDIATKDVAKKAISILGDIDIQTPSGKWIKVSDINDDFFHELGEGTRLTPGFLKSLFWDNPKKFLQEMLTNRAPGPAMAGIPKQL